MRRVLLAAVLTTVLSLVLASGAAAAELSEFCFVEAQSFAAGDEPIDFMAAPGAGGTLADPFDVELAGGVEWIAASQGPITNHNWRVHVYGVPIMFGGDENEEEDTEADGAVGVGEALAGIPITGLFQVSGSIEGEGGSCSGSAWIRLLGNPVFSVLSIVGYILTLLGLLTLFFSLPSWRLAPATSYAPGGPAATAAVRRDRHPLRALLAGLLLGLGVSLILISYGAAPLAEWTPLTILLLFIVLAQAVAWLGPTRGREPVAPM